MPANTTRSGKGGLPESQISPNGFGTKNNVQPDAAGAMRGRVDSDEDWECAFC